MPKLTDALGITDSTKARRREAIKAFKHSESDQRIAEITAELNAVRARIAENELIVLWEERSRLEGERQRALTAADQQRRNALDMLVRTCPNQVCDVLHTIKSALNAWNRENRPTDDDRAIAWYGRGTALAECCAKLYPVTQSPRALADLRGVVDQYRDVIQELRYVTVPGEDDA